MSERVVVKIPALASLDESAIHLGAREGRGTTIYRRFQRGLYPNEFLVRVTPRRLAVDLPGLLTWITKNQGPSRTPQQEATPA